MKTSRDKYFEYSFMDKALRCKGKAATDKATILGWCFGCVTIKDQVWAVVIWDNDKEPEFYKPKLLLVEQKAWVSL